MALFRTMQSIERALKQMKVCGDKGQFLSNFQFLFVHAPIVFMNFLFWVEMPIEMFFVNHVCERSGIGKILDCFMEQVFWNKVPVSEKKGLQICQWKIANEKIFSVIFRWANRYWKLHL